MKWLWAASVTTILLIACVEKESPEAAPEQETWVDVGKNNDLRQHTFPDGTRCVVLDGVNGETVVCDWSYARPMRVEQ